MGKRSTKDWILGKLKETNYNFDIVRNSYEELRKDGIKVTEGSFQRIIRDVASRLRESETYSKSTEDIERNSINIDDYDYSEMLGILDSFTKEKGSILTMRDLSHIKEETNIPAEVWLTMFPDFTEICKNLYKENMLHLKDEMKHKKLSEDISFLKKENRHLKEKESFIERTIEVLEEVVREYEPITGVNLVNRKGIVEREAVALFSDWHFGETVSSEEVHGVNAYNVDIAKERIDIYFNELKTYLIELNVSVLNLALLGDLISGRIHEELMEHSSLETSYTIIILADYISQWIHELSKDFKIKVLGIPGNHGRFNKKPSFKGKYVDNFEFLVYEFIRREVKNVVEEFDVPESMFKIKTVIDTNICFTHGDIFRGGTGLSPVSGTWARDVAKLNGLMRNNDLAFDIMCFGHFHTGDMKLQGFDGTKIVINGSGKGTDEFSIGAVKTGNRPNQSIFIVEKGMPGITRFFNSVFLD
jgi:hypothetical protein